ncbi:MAG: radical SAM protein [Bacteroidales bacterium]|nr:radical SAM protein [Bacteroidales bacterium]
MKKKHFNIPVFIPELACPFQCIYCNQQKISGQIKIPDSNEIVATIENYLQTIHAPNAIIELAFFGGNFTGLNQQEQVEYLKSVQPYIKQGKISGIRLSTRPDYVNKEIIEILKKYHVTTIELGAQSMDNEVLKLSKRGHTAEDTEFASKLILDSGFTLGLQMMIGLPGDTLEKARISANRIVELGADNTRIYPALVIKGTEFENMYAAGIYKPLSLDNAVSWSKDLLKIFESGGVDIIKLGLHPSEGLLSGHDLIAGPFHQSFRELVLTKIWGELFEPMLLKKGEKIEIFVPPDQFNYAVGYEARNKKLLLNNFREVVFKPSSNLKRRIFKVIISKAE